MRDSSSSSPRLLVIDDDSELREILKGLFKDERYQVDLAASLDEAITLIGTRVYHLILTDLLAHSPSDPLRNATIIQREATPTAVMAITGWNITAAEIEHAGLARLIPKPFDVGELLKIVSASLPTLSADQQRAAETARRFCAAFNAHDAEACMATCTEDVQIEQPEESLWASSDTIIGPSACRAHLEYGWSVVPDLRIEEYVTLPHLHGLALRCVKSWTNHNAPDERIVATDTITLRFTDERISGISVQKGGIRWPAPVPATTFQPGLPGAQDQQG